MAGAAGGRAGGDHGAGAQGAGTDNGKFASAIEKMGKAADGLIKAGDILSKTEPVGIIDGAVS